MARAQVSIVRREPWGTITYDTSKHAFDYSETSAVSAEPYSALPVALNVVVTRHCNLQCLYCVAHDFEGIEASDLTITDGLVQWLNTSPFMLLVLTGGEPFMPPYDAATMRLVRSITGKGLVVDTNGTILPSRSMIEELKSKKVLVRVSMDSTAPEDEFKVRVAGARDSSRSAYFQKLANIESMIDAGVDIAIQTVVWRKNTPLDQMIDWMAHRGIRQWYLQRLIPSHKFRQVPERNSLSSEQYYPFVESLSAAAASAGIHCVAKRDLRHNSVFLLTGDGVLYTQGEEPGQKIRLGTVGSYGSFFEYVSPADHAARYYLAESGCPPRSQERRG